MVNLFLCSSFSNVAGVFQQWLGTSHGPKTVTFIPTASLPEKVNFYVKSARKSFEKLGITVDDLEILSASYDEAAQKIATNDFIYISGGNTFFLLQELRRTGLDRLISDHIASGKCYIGESAGAMVLAPSIEYAKDMDDPTLAPHLKSTAGLGLTSFYTLPHRASFPFKKVVEKVILKYSHLIELKPISNSQALGLRDGTVLTLEK